MTSQKDIYLSRIGKVHNYVNENLNKKISIAELANVANFSSFHFHRIFQALMNESVNNYINRIKLEKATQKLSYTDKPILDIALDCGFSSTATFSRAFRNYFECSPSHYRKKGLPKDSRICKNIPTVSEYICTMNDEQTVIIKELEFKKIAYITVYNSFEEGKVLKFLKLIIDWAKQVNVYKQGDILGMSLDDVMVTPKDKYRYLIGITIPEDFVFTHSQIKSMSIPKSKYAISKVNGTIENVINSWNYLYNTWLINSDYEPNHLYAFEKYLDKEKANDWSNFDLEIALPIKSLSNY